MDYNILLWSNGLALLASHPPSTSIVKYTNGKVWLCLCTINFVSAHNYGNINGYVMCAFNLQS